MYGILRRIQCAPSAPGRTVPMRLKPHLPRIFELIPTSGLFAFFKVQEYLCRQSAGENPGIKAGQAEISASLLP